MESTNRSHPIANNGASCGTAACKCVYTTTRALEPRPQPEPSPHGTHVVAVVAPVACENVSAAQSTHAEDPVEFLNVPAGQ